MNDPLKFKQEVTDLLEGAGLSHPMASSLHHELLSIYKRNYPERHPNDFEGIIKSYTDDTSSHDSREAGT